MCSKTDCSNGFTYLNILRTKIWIVHFKWANCMAYELDLNKLVRKKGPPPPGSLPCCPPSSLGLSALCMYVCLGRSLGTQHKDWLAHIWSEGHAWRSHLFLLVEVTFPMGFSLLFRGIWKRFCPVLETSGISGGRGRSEFETGGLRGGSRASWSPTTQSSDPREDLCFTWLVFLARVYLQTSEKWVVRLSSSLVTLVT